MQFEGQVLQLVIKLLPLLEAATAHMSLQQEMLMAAIWFVKAATNHRTSEKLDAVSEVCCAVPCCAVFCPAVLCRAVLCCAVLSCGLQIDRCACTRVTPMYQSLLSLFLTPFHLQSPYVCPACLCLSPHYSTEQRCSLHTSDSFVHTTFRSNQSTLVPFRAYCNTAVQDSSQAPKKMIKHGSNVVLLTPDLYVGLLLAVP